MALMLGYIAAPWIAHKLPKESLFWPVSFPWFVMLARGSPMGHPSVTHGSLIGPPWVSHSCTVLAHGSPLVGHVGLPLEYKLTHGSMG